MTEPFAPITITTTATRCKDGEEASTTVVRESLYNVDLKTDTLTLNLLSVVLQRGGYGDAYRETVRLEHYTEDIVSDAVVALVAHCAHTAQNPDQAESYRARCTELLQRIARQLPAEVRQPVTTAVEA